jgi:hypothetical protein
VLDEKRLLLNHDPSSQVGRMEGDVAHILPGVAPASGFALDASYIVEEAEVVDGVKYATKVRLLGFGLVAHTETDE